MKPAGFTEGTKVPAVLEIHGGPQAMYGHTFMHEFQPLVAPVMLYSTPTLGVATDTVKYTLIPLEGITADGITRI